jgi:hypothetical protein
MAEDRLAPNERLVRCETMLVAQSAQLITLGLQVKEADAKLDGLVEYVNTRKGAFRLAERIGLVVMTLSAALVGSALTWLHRQ